MPDIARCAKHGLHGERQVCFVCGGPVEQVAMVLAAEAQRLRVALQQISSRSTDPRAVELAADALYPAVAEP